MQFTKSVFGFKRQVSKDDVRKYRTLPSFGVESEEWPLRTERSLDDSDVHLIGAGTIASDQVQATTNRPRSGSLEFRNSQSHLYDLNARPTVKRSSKIPPSDGAKTSKSKREAAAKRAETSTTASAKVSSKQSQDGITMINDIDNGIPSTIQGPRDSPYRRHNNKAVSPEPAISYRRTKVSPVVSRHDGAATKVEIEQATNKNEVFSSNIEGLERMPSRADWIDHSRNNQARHSGSPIAVTAPPVMGPKLKGHIRRWSAPVESRSDSPSKKEETIIRIIGTATKSASPENGKITATNAQNEQDDAFQDSPQKIMAVIDNVRQSPPPSCKQEDIHIDSHNQKNLSVLDKVRMFERKDFGMIANPQTLRPVFLASADKKGIELVKQPYLEPKKADPPGLSKLLARLDPPGTSKANPTQLNSSDSVADVQAAKITTKMVERIESASPRSVKERIFPVDMHTNQTTTISSPSHRFDSPAEDQATSNELTMVLLQRRATYDSSNVEPTRQNSSKAPVGSMKKCSTKIAFQKSSSEGNICSAKQAAAISPPISRSTIQQSGNNEPPQESETTQKIGSPARTSKKSILDQNRQKSATTTATSPFAGRMHLTKSIEAPTAGRDALNHSIDASNRGSGTSSIGRVASNYTSGIPQNEESQVSSSSVRQSLVKDGPTGKVEILAKLWQSSSPLPSTKSRTYKTRQLNEAMQTPNPPAVLLLNKARLAAPPQHETSVESKLKVAGTGNHSPKQDACKAPKSNKADSNRENEKTKVDYRSPSPPPPKSLTTCHNKLSRRETLEDPTVFLENKLPQFQGKTLDICSTEKMFQNEEMVFFASNSLFKPPHHTSVQAELPPENSSHKPPPRLSTSPMRHMHLTHSKSQEKHNRSEASSIDSSSMQGLEREPLSESRRVNSEDPNLCTYWVKSGDGTCEHLEFNVENMIAPGQEIESAAVIPTKKKPSRSASSRVYTKLWKDKDQNEEYFQPSSTKSCLTPSNSKKSGRRRKVKPSLSFRGRSSARLRTRRSFSLSSAR